MKKFVVIMMAAILVFSLATPVFAQNPLEILLKIVGGTIKGAADIAIMAPLETVGTGLGNVLKGKDGPIVSLLGRGPANGVGRAWGGLTTIFGREDAYEVDYFTDNPIAEKISTPPIIDLADWVGTAVFTGIAGVNSNLWGGMAKGWTRVKAVMIGATAGALTNAVVKTAAGEPLN